MRSLLQPKHVTRFYHEARGQWYRAIVVKFGMDQIRSAADAQEVESWLIAAGFEPGQSEILRDVDRQEGCISYCQNIPVSREAVEQDCGPPHPRHEAPKPELKARSLEEMRQWMRVGCPM